MSDRKASLEAALSASDNAARWALLGVAAIAVGTALLAPRALRIAVALWLILP